MPSPREKEMPPVWVGFGGSGGQGRGRDAIGEQTMKEIKSDDGPLGRFMRALVGPFGAAIGMLGTVGKDGSPVPSRCVGRASRWSTVDGVRCPVCRRQPAASSALTIVFFFIFRVLQGDANISIGRAEGKGSGAAK